MTDVRTVDPQFHLPARRVIGLAILAAIVFWFARPVIAPFLVAAFIAYAFDPLVDAVQTRTGRSRYVVVFVAVGISVAILLLVAALAAGPAIREAQLLIASGPAAIETALRQILGADSVTVGDRTITVEELAAQAQAAISKLLQTPEGALRVAEQILHSTLDIVLTIIVTFYLLLDGDRFARTALRFLQPADRSQMARVGGRIHVVLGHWLRGQLVLIAFVAIVVWFVLGPILGIPHSTALGILTGVLEIIPLVGPLIAGLVVAIVALSAGGIGLAVVAVVFLFVLRQIEDAVVMPLVVGRAVHLHPLVALFAVVVGTTAFGVLGTFLAVPVAAAVNVALHEFFPEELGASPGMPPAAATVTPGGGPTVGRAGGRAGRRMTTVTP